MFFKRNDTNGFHWHDMMVPTDLQHGDEELFK